MNTNQTLQKAGRNLKGALQPVLILVGALWLIELVDRLFFHEALDRFGIVPRTAAGLWGIPLAPLLHSSFAHLLANTLPLIILGTLVMLTYRSRFLAITGVIILVSGLGTWLISPAQTIHIGASGLIFGYLAFLVAVAYHERSFGAVALAVLVIILYGGVIGGILPQDGGISWQGHLFGLIGGGLAAYLFARRRARTAESAI